MSASKFNWSAAVLWVLLAPAPFVFFVAVQVLASKAPSMAGAYSLVPYALVPMLVGMGIKGGARWRSLRGLIGLPFVIVGGAGLAAILAVAIMHG